MLCLPVGLLEQYCKSHLMLQARLLCFCSAVGRCRNQEKNRWNREQADAWDAAVACCSAMSHIKEVQRRTNAKLQPIKNHELTQFFPELDKDAVGIISTWMPTCCIYMRDANIQNGKVRPHDTILEVIGWQVLTGLVTMHLCNILLMPEWVLYEIKE